MVKSTFMKRLIYSIVAATLVVATTLKVSAQTDQTRNVSGFNGIAASGPFTVHVKIDGTESLKISAGTDIANDIETIVEDGKLEIKFKNHHGWTHDNVGKVDIYVTAKSISSLANSGSGSIKVDGALSGENVYITLSGSGSITSSVKSGDLHATISGSGSIRLDGNSQDAKVTIAGSGELNGKEFKTVSANVVITGSGSAHFAADKSIAARIVGSGNVVYSGNASVDSKTIGSGRVSKAE